MRKKHQKYSKALDRLTLTHTKLTDIVTLALAVFETSTSKTLKNSKIDEREFGILWALSMNHLIICLRSTARWRQKTETNSKSLWEEINNLKKKLRRNAL